MTEKIKFFLRFEFEHRDLKKALKLHRLLKEYGAVDKITNMKDISINKEDRLKAILDCLRPGRIYTTGQLYKVVKNKGGALGDKTFQRDLNTLVIRGEIKGFKRTDHKGNTILWSNNKLKLN